MSNKNMSGFRYEDILFRKITAIGRMHQSQKAATPHRNQTESNKSNRKRLFFSREV